MPEKEDPYKKFQESMLKLHGKIHVLNTAIPIEEQTLYFKLSQKVKEDLNEEMVLSQKDLLFDALYEPEFKKRLLLSLATLDNIEAYRAIEKYSEQPDEYLLNWAVIALEESKMNIERTLSDVEQIFISTGLGGRDEKLRFFIVFFPASKGGFTEFQLKTAKNELEFIFEKNKCELEEFTEYSDYFTITALFPFKLNMKDILNGYLNEVNQYGNFIRMNLLITNIKIFNNEEILSSMKQDVPEESSIL